MLEFQLMHFSSTKICLMIDFIVSSNLLFPFLVIFSKFTMISNYRSSGITATSSTNSSNKSRALLQIENMPLKPLSEHLSTSLSRSGYNRFRRYFELPSMKTLSRLLSLKVQMITNFLTLLFHHCLTVKITFIDEVYIKSTLQFTGSTLWSSGK